MKQAQRAGLLFSSAFFLLFSFAIFFVTGCGNFWQPPATTTTTSTCTTNCTTATSGNFYILNASTTPQIVGESIVAGKLTPITGSPWSLGDVTPYSMAIAPDGDFLVVGTTSGVLVYPISNGVLGTAVNVSSDQAYGLAVDATSSWLLEAIPETGGLTFGAIPINTTTGAATGTEQNVSFTVTSAAVQPNQMVISGDNANIFVALGAGGTIVVPFNAAVTSGSNPLSTKGTTIPVATTSGGSALSVSVDAGTAPGLFYIGEVLGDAAGTSGGLRVFNYSSLGSSKLTQATGSPIASGGLAPNFILPATSGNYVYVANGTGASSAGNITGFTITSTGTTTLTYSVATNTSTAAGVQPLSLAEDSSSQFISEVGTLGSPYLESYTFDSTTLGQLDSQIVSTSASGSIAIVAAP